MAKICTNEKTASRQRWIENGLLELMQEQKFEDITVTALCLHLELSRRSFYRYFSDIEDVLDSLMHRTFQEMPPLTAPFGIGELTASYDFWLQRKPLLSALIRSQMHGKLTEYTLKYVDEEVLKKNLTPDVLDLEISHEVNLFVVTGLASLLISWYLEGFRKTPEQMARIAYRMLTAPILRE